MTPDCESLISWRLRLVALRAPACGMTHESIRSGPDADRGGASLQTRGGLRQTRAKGRHAPPPWRPPGAPFPFGEKEKGMKGLPWAFKNKGDDARLHPPAAVGRSVGDAGFFEIQFVFDTATRLVGDLAVAQQFINEFAFRLDQVRLDPGGLAHVVETFGQILWQHLQAAGIARA